MKKQKIISGNFAYIHRMVQEWAFYDYKVVRSKRWSDGKYTIVMEKQ